MERWPTIKRKRAALVPVPLSHSAWRTNVQPGPGLERLVMTTMSAAAVAAMFSQSQLRLVNADTPSIAIVGRRMMPTLNSSETAAINIARTFDRPGAMPARRSAVGPNPVTRPVSSTARLRFRYRSSARRFFSLRRRVPFEL